MEIIITLLSNTVFLLLCFLETAIWLRVILGSVFAADDSVLYRALIFITEPFLLPVRALLDRMRLSGRLLDLSAVVWSAILIPVMAILPEVTV